MRVVQLIIALILIFPNSVLSQAENSNYMDVLGTQLYYEVHGEGTPLILIHGGIGYGSYYDAIVPELAKSFKTIIIDSPGHGRSEYIDTLSYQLIASHLEEFIDLMSFDSAYVFGFSDGAVVALLMAYDKPSKIKKIVSAGGVLSPHKGKGGIEALKGITVDVIPEIYKQQYQEVSPNPERWDDFIERSREMWLSEIWVPESILNKITCETLIMVGDRDPFIPIEHNVYIYNKIQNSQLAIIPNSGHDIFSDRNTNDLIHSVVTKFFLGK